MPIAWAVVFISPYDERYSPGPIWAPFSSGYFVTFQGLSVRCHPVKSMVLLPVLNSSIQSSDSPASFVAVVLFLDWTSWITTSIPLGFTTVSK